MSDPPSDIERRLDDLARQVDALSRRVDDLASKLAPRELPPAAAADRIPSAAAPNGIPLAQWSPGSRTTLLSDAATVCFVLVIALVLRTITENGVVGPRTGALLGLGYAGLLMLWGWRAYATAARHALVFTLGGALLLFSVLVETHVHFGALSAPVAYIALLATLALLSAVGLIYRVRTLVCGGVLLAGLVGMALGFPELAFPWVGGLLWAANVTAYAGARCPRCSWARGGVWGLTMLFWLLWTAKLRAPLLRGDAPSAALWLPWFLPLLAAFAALYLGLVLAAVVQRGGRLGVFESLLPSANVAWAYAAALAVVGPWLDRGASVAAAGVVAAVAHLVLATTFARKGAAGARAVGAFSLAGVLALVLALPGAACSLHVALWLWSATALALLILSRRWANGWLRWIAYLLQGIACLAALASGVLAVPGEAPLLTVSTAAALSLFSAAQYAWCRTHAPCPTAAGAAHVDPEDRAAVIPLITALVGAFGLLRVALFALLPYLPGDDANTFLCLQSVLINAGAVLLLLAGLRWRSTEFLAVAALVALAGALKVFAGDLPTAHGLPLAASVLSLGIVAAVGSVVVRHLQQSAASQPL